MRKNNPELFSLKMNRKKWNKPELMCLYISMTADGAGPGNDGNTTDPINVGS